MKNIPEIVYCYCKPHVFESIIQNRKMWLCDMMKTNDYREIDYVLDDIVKAVNVNFISQVIPKEDAVLVEHAINARINFYKRCCHWLAICLSTEKDDLGQWREYGDDGSGFAIGFDAEFLQSITSHKCFRFENIKYGENAKNKFTHFVAFDLLERFRACSKRNSIRSKTGLNNKGRNIIREWGDELTDKICFYKSEAFSNEKEYRLCYTRMIIDKDWATIIDPKVSPESMLHNLAVSMKNNEVNLRIEKEFSPAAIREIVMGPKCNISPYEMQLLLAINGFDFKNLVITQSKVTYRR